MAATTARARPLAPAAGMAVLLALLLGLLAGCGGSDGGEPATPAASRGLADVPADGDQAAGGGEAAATDGSAAGPAGVLSGRVDPVRREVVHTVELTVAVDGAAALGRAAREATRLVTVAGGYVEQESTTTGDGEATSTLVMRVPVDVHAQVVGDLEQLGTVRDRHRSAQDVTDELVDVESRVASQRASLDRLRALLERAGSLADVVALESEIARREADLDSLLQRQAQLSGLADLATVTLTLVRTDDEPAEEAVGFTSGLRAGWAAFLDVVRGGLAALGAVLPFAAAGLLVGVPAWRVLRARRRRTQAAPAGPA